MRRHRNGFANWTAFPALKIGRAGNADEYRLENGRLAFRPARTRKWRLLSYPEVKHHITLDTPVGRWLGQLASTAKVAELLSQQE